MDDTDTSIPSIPNLDCATDEDVRAHEKTFRLLSDYASLVLEARHERLQGRIERACEIERRLERLYSQLPAWARW